MKSTLISLTILFLCTVASHANEYKYSMSLFHFNIEYVAGGGEYFEDIIITESFEPLLDLFLLHPNWGFNVELQGYFLEVLEARHPGVLQKVQTLVQRDQIELMSFHYGDQLFLAFPRHDMVKSADMVKDIYANYNLRLSPTVFTQEGQYGEGMLPFMQQYGYSICMLPKNLYRYFHPNVPFYPLYEHRSTDVVVVGVGGEVPFGSDTVAYNWSFYNDGELLATNDMAPYLGPLFKHDPAAVQEYEDELLDLESRGYKIVKVEDCIAELHQMNFPSRPIRPVVDGTWQPKDTQNIYRWMGGAGEFGLFEDDNYIRTLNYKARNLLLGAESMITYAKRHNVTITSEERKLADAWQKQLFAEVSDSTGWNPMWMEVDYSINNSNYAIGKAHEIIESLRQKMNLSYFYVDTFDQNIVATGPFTFTPTTTTPVTPEIEDSGRGVDTQWYNCDQDANHYKVSLHFGTTTPSVEREIIVKFLHTSQTVQYCPALLEEELVEYDLADFDQNDIYLPLSNGLLGLGSDRWIIKHCTEIHLAGMISKDGYVYFKDQVAKPDREYNWVFSIFDGDKNAAVSLANRLNTWPVLGLGDPSTPTPTVTATPTNTPTPTSNHGPHILMAGYWDSSIDRDTGGKFTFYAICSDFDGDEISSVEVYYQWSGTGVELPLVNAGAGLYVLPESQVGASAGYMRFTLQLTATDVLGGKSLLWPYLMVK